MSTGSSPRSGAALASLSERIAPLLLDASDLVVDVSGATANLGGRGDEEGSTREDAPLDVREEALTKGEQALRLPAPGLGRRVGCWSAARSLSPYTPSATSGSTACSTGARVLCAHHDHSVSYTLYLLTYAVDSVADVFGSLFVFAAGVLVFRSGVLPWWLGWVSILAAPLLFLQAFGLGGAIASFGLVLDLIGFVLLLVFVLISSVVSLRRVEIGWRRRSSRIVALA